MAKGYIYIIVNQAMPQYYKIGKTERDVRKRVDEFFWTNVPVPFEIVYACEVDDMDTIEKHIHSVFSDKRKNPNREFFEVEPQKVIEVLERDRGFIKNITDTLQNEISENITQEDIQASEEIKRNRRANFNFNGLGITVGSELIYKNNENKKVIVVDNKFVKYNDGNPISLSALTKQFVGYACAPLPYWTYNGKNLGELFDELYPKEEE